MEKHTSRHWVSCVCLFTFLSAMMLTAVSCVNPKQEVRQELRQKDREDGLLDVGDPVERKIERKVDRKF